MKAILEFNIPEDGDQFTRAVHASDYYSVIWDLDQHLRGVIKYQDLPDEKMEVYEAVRKYLHDLLDANGIELY